jgi:transmembrane sensor
MRESPAHVRELIEHALIEHDLRHLPVSSQEREIAVAEARKESARVLPLGNLEVATKQTSGRAWRMYGAAAAACVALSALSVSYWNWQRDRFTTAVGEQRLLTLSDGSIVTLNTNTVLKVRISRAARNIDLIKGEAFFRVAHDAKRPFAVAAEGTTVKAVGTAFNIRIAPRDTLVSVLDGRVIVASGEPQPITLGRGEEAQVTHGEERHPNQPARVLKKKHPAALRASAWTLGRVEFDNVALQDVLDEFQRYRPLDVHVEDATLAALELTGSFDAHDPESMLAYVATLPGVTVERDGERFFIRRQ